MVVKCLLIFPAKVQPERQKGAWTATAADKAFVSHVSFEGVVQPDSWLRLYWFKLINPLTEDVDSAALERLK